jgi:hypothetical protein
MTVTDGAGEAEPAFSDAAPLASAMALDTGPPLDGRVPLAAATPARPPAVWTIPAVRSAMPANDATMAAAIRVRGVRRIRALLREG